MSMTDPIADMLTRIRNAQTAMHQQVAIPASKMKIAIADVLKAEGYILDYKIEEENVKKSIIIFLKYFEDRKVIELIKRISVPGRRVYKNYKELKPVLGGMGIAILSTSKGIMTDRAAKKAQIGGEVLCEVA